MELRGLLSGTESIQENEPPHFAGAGSVSIEDCRVYKSTSASQAFSDSIIVKSVGRPQRILHSVR